MYCKKCGKKIADDSLFCKYCGAKQDGILEDSSLYQNDVIDEDSSSTQTDTIEKESSSVHVEPHSKDEVFEKFQIYKDEQKQRKKVNLANELVAIGKVLGLAVCIWLLYWFIFDIYHIEDVKSPSEVRFGLGCYDNLISYGGDVISTDYTLNDDDAEREFKMLVEDEKRKGLDKPKYGFLPNGQKIRISAHPMWSNMTKEQKEEWKKETIENDKARFEEDVKTHRLLWHEKKRKKNLLYSAITILSVLFIGRYLYKIIVWTNNNRTS